jgi:GNAT superfamily N-acetyltransferase
VSSAVLTQSDWVVPGVDRVKVCFASNAYARDADRTWPSQRRSDDTNRHWCWFDICKAATEKFAVVGHSTGLLALWTGHERRRRIEGRLHYRLERLEVAPSWRGTHLSVFVLVTIALRARERGCSSVLFSALPGTRAFYTKAGAEEVPKGYWEDSSGLPGWMFPETALDELVELQDVFSVDQNPEA